MAERFALNDLLITVQSTIEKIEFGSRSRSSSGSGPVQSKLDLCSSLDLLQKFGSHQREPILQRKNTDPFLFL